MAKIFITAGAPHNPTAGFGVAVGAGDAAETGAGITVERTGRVAFGSGVQVAGNPSGVTVASCRAGPSGLCQTPLYRKITSPNKASATTDRKAMITFWKEVINY